MSKVQQSAEGNVKQQNRTRQRELLFHVRATGQVKALEITAQSIESTRTGYFVSIFHWPTGTVSVALTRATTTKSSHLTGGVRKPPVSACPATDLELSAAVCIFL